jgi:hypothetical protein
LERVGRYDRFILKLVKKRLDFSSTLSYTKYS